MSKVSMRRSWCGAALIATAVALAFAAPAAAEETIIYFHQDALGSVRLVTGNNGEVLARHDYLPFGEEVPAGQFGRAPDAGYGAVEVEPQHFTGRERDTESSLDYFGARYYSAAMGRWTSVDPAMNWRALVPDPQRWNRCTDARDNPYLFVDPDGREITVYTETIGSGHTWIHFWDQGGRSVIFSFGNFTRNHKSASSIAGPGVLYRWEGTTKYLAKQRRDLGDSVRAFHVRVPNEKAAYEFLQTLWAAGRGLTVEEAEMLKARKDEPAAPVFDAEYARITLIDYLVSGTNCTTLIVDALLAGGLPVEKKPQTPRALQALFEDADRWSPWNPTPVKPVTSAGSGEATQAERDYEERHDLTRH